MKKTCALCALGIMVISLMSCSQDLLEEIKVSESAHADTTVVQEPVAVARTTNFYFGVNGQPLSSVHPYKAVSAKDQVNVVKSLGMNIYRFGAAFQIAKGLSTVPYLQKPLIQAAEEGQITLLPYFSIRTLSYDKTDDQNYNEAQAFGKLIGEVNGKDFEYYEVGNELDNKCIIRGTGYAGDQLTHYDQAKLSSTAAAINGIIDGIKSSDPNAKIIVNCSWVHYAFMDYLLQHNAKIDIIGWHWYSDMESAALKTYGITDIGQYLYERYKKDIWFTEFNLRANRDGASMDEKEQEAFVNGFLNKCRQNPHVGAALIWELFDQPNRTPDERNYGIITYADNVVNNMDPKIFAEFTSALFQ